MESAIYKIGDFVSFIYERKIVTGRIVVVDYFGTTEQQKEPSYDIFDNENNITYKHIVQSCLIN